MFETIRFRMVNSIGTPVNVNLFNDRGIIGYEILFPSLGVVKSEKLRLNKKDSDKFLQSLKKMGLIPLLSFYLSLAGEKEEKGDYWKLDIELPDGKEISLSGPDPSGSVLYPLLMDFSEILDRTFPITRLVDPGRVDRLEISFVYNEVTEHFQGMIPDFRQCEHTETLVVDRHTKTVSYSKRFPSRCFHSTYEAKCEHHVRDILDGISVALNDDSLLQDEIDVEENAPELTFEFLFHDGSSATVRKTFACSCFGDDFYKGILETVSENLIVLLFKEGLFDKRFMIDRQYSADMPFFLVYGEGDMQVSMGSLDGEGA